MKNLNDEYRFGYPLSLRFFDRGRIAVANKPGNPSDKKSGPMDIFWKLALVAFFGYAIWAGFEKLYESQHHKPSPCQSAPGSSLC